MSSDQKPEKWGYGLTWLITAGLVVMVAIGVVKLRKTAIDSAAHLRAEKAKAMEAAKQQFEAETKATEALETADKKAAEEKAKQLALAADPPASAEDIAMGKTIYATCAACHGPEGSGSLNPMAIKAPNLAGMPAWYAATQIRNMKNDIRGGAGDMEAMMMKPMVMNLTDKQIDQVSAYLESLKPVAPKHTLKGDAAKGKALYATCLACHMDKGQGNPLVKSPPINNLPDWYIVSSLKKFKSKVRGGNPKDLTGMQMSAMAATLADEQAMKDVAEYIKTLAE
ncbi:MAG: c-type cytochrome [Lentisphaerales bacterium]|nr:c-type cytochrome [Lentisphaerales bacterium]